MNYDIDIIKMNTNNKCHYKFTFKTKLIRKRLFYVYYKLLFKKSRQDNKISKHKISVILFKHIILLKQFVSYITYIFLKYEFLIIIHRSLNYLNMH